jgi:hypothetical protein
MFTISNKQKIPDSVVSLAKMCETRITNITDRSIQLISFLVVVLKSDTNCPQSIMSFQASETAQKTSQPYFAVVPEC